MGRYATNTSVSVEKSRAEVETILKRYGARQFMYATDDDRNQAMVQFVTQGRQVRVLLPLPSRKDPKYQYTPARRRKRTTDGVDQAWEQDCRQAWRALVLVIKAKLEAVDAGIATFEQEFMAYLVLPNNRTAGDVMIPQIVAAQDSGKMPPALPWGGSDEAS